MILFKDDMRGDELKELYRAIWRLAWPASFAMFVRQISMFILRVLSSQLGEKAYNSVNIGLIVFMIIVTVIGAIAVGTVALVAQSWGAGKREQAGRVLQQSLLWGLILSLIIPIVGIHASGLLYVLPTDDPETIRLGTFTNNQNDYSYPAAPTDGTWKRGQTVFFTAPSAGGKIGAVCVTGGTPGTWKDWGVIDA